jgi:molecular chaperone IbpA
MRTFDFAPLTRSSIGFDRMFDLLSNRRWDEQPDFPPYNIARRGEDAFRITIALAGFTPEQITIMARQNELTVSGKQPEDAGGEYLHRGISTREFEQRFSLADHVEVEDASFENGLLHIDLVRRIPEAMKPRRIEIGAARQSKSVTGKVERLRQAS